jgi:hypothetical protein
MDKKAESESESGTTGGKTVTFSVYNDCNNTRTLTALRQMAKCKHITEKLERRRRCGREGEDDPEEEPHGFSMIWAGDLNVHHPLWEDPINHHLFTAANLNRAQELMNLVDDHGMEIVLPGRMHLMRKECKELHKTR